ncbi:hypothetical protein CHUAL_005983 [Chamberlinius hualienensis]
MTYWRLMTLAAVFRILSDFISFIGPLSISVIVTYSATLSRNESQPKTQKNYVSVREFVSNGYVMAVLVLISALVQSGLAQAFTHMVIVEGIKLRSAVQTFIFKNVLRLPSWVTNGGNGNGVSVINFITQDAFNIMMLFFMGHYIWAMPLKIVAVLFLLYRLLGYSALIGAASMLLLIPLQYFIGTFMSKNQKLLLKASDNRLRRMNEVLQGIRQLKLYAWEFVFTKTITEARKKELKYLLKDQIFWMLNSFLTDTSTVLVSLVTFSVYPFIEGKSLSATDVFAGLALFSQLGVPMFLFPITIPIIIAADVSTNRLTKFLEIIESTVNNDSSNEKIFTRNSVEIIPNNLGSMQLRIKDEVEEEEDEEEDEDHFEENNEERIVIQLKNASFSWKCKSTNDLTLQDLSVNIQSAQLTVVVGGVGSGKSSFLLALMAEMNLVKGAAKWENNDAPLAYVSQKPWLLNASIRDNILFGKKYVSKWYQYVVSACSLGPDFDILPDGDETEIGEKGVTLSGGQKQRISLARAIYCKVKTLIMDDPTSALDAQVSLQVFESIVNLVKKRKRTVILTTTRIQFLPQAHKVIVMENGRIKHQNTFVEIVKADANLYNAWMDTINREEKECELKDCNSTKTVQERRKLKRLLTIQAQSPPKFDPKKSFLRGISLTRQMSCDLTTPVPFHDCGEEGIHFFPEDSDLSSSASKRLHTNSPATSAKISFMRMMSTVTSASEVPSEDPRADEGFSEKLLSGEDRERGQINRKLYVKYMKCCGWIFCFLFFCFSIFARTVSVSRDFWLSRWSQAAHGINNNYSNTSFESEMRYYLIGYSSLSVSGIIISLISNVIALYGGYRALSILHDGMLNSVIRSPIRFFDLTPVGRIINRFSSDMGAIDRKLQTTMQTLIHFLLMCISAVVVNAVVNPYFLIVTVPLLIVYYFIQRYFRASSRELQRLDSLTKSPVLSHVNEILGGLITIRAFREEKRFLKKMLMCVDANNTAFLMMNSANRWLGVALDFLGAIIVFLATIIAMIAASNGTVSPSFVGLAVSYTLLVPIYLNWVVRHLSDLEMYMSAVERVHQYTHLDSENYNQGKEPRKDWPKNGEICFNEASLRYDSSLGSAISRLSLKIKPGKKVGICGRTGSGKSSLALGLFGVLDKFEGEILIDGLDIHEIPLLRLRSSIAIIPQDAILFAGTLRWNLDPLNEHSNEKLWESLELSQMKDVISGLDGGLDTLVTDNGDNFSAGQKQLLCLARAILCPSKILVMDEATASLDEGMDHIVQQVIAKSFVDRTILTIAHHISTILNYDTIVVLDQGHILEQGSPQHLLQRPGSVFASLLKTSQGK